MYVFKTDQNAFFLIIIFSHRTQCFKEAEGGVTDRLEFIGFLVNPYIKESIYPYCDAFSLLSF